MKILIINDRYAWSSIWDCTFLTSSQISLMLLILKIKHTLHTDTFFLLPEIPI